MLLLWQLLSIFITTSGFLNFNDTFNTLLYYSIYTIKQPFSFDIFITFAKRAIKINTTSRGVHIFLNLYLSNHLKKPSKFYHHSMKCQIILPPLCLLVSPSFADRFAPSHVNVLHLFQARTLNLCNTQEILKFLFVGELIRRLE